MVPFLGTPNIRCRIIIGIQKGTIILTTTHILYTYMDSLGQAPGLVSRNQEMPHAAETVVVEGCWKSPGLGFRV